MDATINTTTRAITQLGTSLVAATGGVVETLDDATLAQVLTALSTVIGDGNVSISADHQTITVNPPSAAWVQQNTVDTARLTLIAQHKAALAAQFATMNASPAQTQNDLTALATIATALQAGTQPTAAQQVIIDRVLVRLMIVLNS